jgi:8-oxo-dGTP diphosphatase
VPYTPILATLAYVMSSDAQSVLLVHRNARANDQHYGKYNGLGGKLEATESVLDGLKREILEEAGLQMDSPVLRGTISWPGFGKGGEDWFAFVFRIDRWSGTPFTRNPEGALEWVPVSRLLKGELNLWEGDKHFLPLVFDDDPRVFHGVMPYRDGRLVSSQFDR